MVQATVQLLNGVEVRKSYDADITAQDLMESIHKFSGIELADMQLTVMVGKDDSIEIKQGMGQLQPLQGGDCRIVVTDTNPRSLANQLLNQEPDNNGEYQFQYTEKDYENRDDTVLKWKQQQQLGRFDPQYKSRMEQDKQTQMESLGNLTIDERCTVATPNKPERRGWLRYLGPVDTLTGVWCGIEFDTPSGKNNGSFKDKVYFGPVGQDHGGFVRPNQVTTGPQYSPLPTNPSLDDTDEL